MIIMLTSAISTIMANYIYKFIGFVIDYGLNYTGQEYSGEMSFLFSGKLGEYGSLKLIITLGESNKTKKEELYDYNSSNIKVIYYK